jgi:membrane protein involved in colicin uptake
MRITESRLRQIIREELTEGWETKTKEFKDWDEGTKDWDEDVSGGRAVRRTARTEMEKKKAAEMEKKKAAKQAEFERRGAELKARFRAENPGASEEEAQAWFAKAAAALAYEIFSNGSQARLEKSLADARAAATRARAEEDFVRRFKSNPSWTK